MARWNYLVAGSTLFGPLFAGRGVDCQLGSPQAHRDGVLGRDLPLPSSATATDSKLNSDNWPHGEVAAK